MKPFDAKAAALAAVFAAACGMVLPALAATTVLDFPLAAVPFPEGTNLTDEYRDEGVVFSVVDEDLPAAYRKNLGAQDNLVTQETLINLFRLYFVTAEAVVSVSITFADLNFQGQTHTLTAFDAAGTVLDSDRLAEGIDDQLYPGLFTLTVGAPGGIDSVVAIEQPFGAERVVRIELSTTTALPSPTRTLTAPRTLIPTHPTPTRSPSFTPTAVATATAIQPVTPTATATASSLPEVTATAMGLRTVTASPEPACAGDCDRSGEVSVDELVTGVSIALGLRPSGDCPELDGNGGGTVTVEELVAAVQAALTGCDDDDDDDSE